MANDPALAIQRALYGVLSADLQLGADVYDYVPEDAPKPYVVVGECYQTPDNVSNAFGAESVATLHIWTRYRGHSQGLEIGERVMQVVDHQPLAVDGFHHVETRFEFMQALVDPDPEIRHVVLRFRICTEEPRV